MKLFVFRQLFVFTFFFLPSCTDLGTEEDIQPPMPEYNYYEGYELVWRDEFNGTALDTTIWNYDIGTGAANGTGSGWGNKELQAYTNRPQNIFIDDGKLIIRALSEKYFSEPDNETVSFTSAMVHTQNKVYWKYGIIEARVRWAHNPQSNITDEAVWGAFRMLPQFNVYGTTTPNNSYLPVNGEIDIMEFGGLEPTEAFGAVHFAKDNEHQFDGGQYHLPKYSFADDYFISTIFWTEEKITWFIDGEFLHEFDLTEPIDGRKPFNEEFYLMLNLAIGGNWEHNGEPDPEDYPQQIMIDWVRVYQQI